MWVLCLGVFVLPGSHDYVHNQDNKTYASGGRRKGSSNADNLRNEGGPEVNSRLCLPLNVFCEKGEGFLALGGRGEYQKQNSLRGGKGRG